MFYMQKIPSFLKKKKTGCCIKLINDNTSYIYYAYINIYMKLYIKRWNITVSSLKNYHLFKKIRLFRIFRYFSENAFFVKNIGMTFEIQVFCFKYKKSVKKYMYIFSVKYHNNLKFVVKIIFLLWQYYTYD